MSPSIYKDHIKILTSGQLSNEHPQHGFRTFIGSSVQKIPLNVPT